MQGYNNCWNLLMYVTKNEETECRTVCLTVLRLKYELSRRQDQRLSRKITRANECTAFNVTVGM